MANKPKPIKYDETHSINVSVTNKDEIKKLGDVNITQFKMVGKTFQTHFDDTIVTCFGPKADGSCILRIQGNPKGSTHRVTGHVEINLKSHHDLNKILQSNLFYDGVASLKLAHFVGYVGENHVKKIAEQGILLQKGFIKNRGRIAMPLLSIFDNNKNIVSKSIFSLQNRNNHGIDLIFKVTPYPPPPKWITIESKTVMKDKFGDYSTPRGGKVSEYQEDPIDNLSKHLELSNISLKSKLNEYSIKKEEKILLQELTHDLLINKSISSNKEIIQGFKLTIGIDEKFNVSNNKKFDNLYIFEKL